MSIPEKVLSLIEVYERNADAYQSPHFKEAELRQQFVNPLFKSLGWDMDNEQGYAEAYKDVVHEAAIKIGGATKAPDYSFRIGGTPKFYLEAKKPSVNLKDDPAPAFQLRRYAWSARMPLSVLTNFNEFAVYDCRIKPAQADKAAAARILYLRRTDYAAAWDEKIASVFSREAVLKGSFDKFADAKKTKRGTATVDAAILDEIESWREELAKNLALRNPELSSRDLNFAVQITIDRIIFLRMCEDRGIEPYGQLRKLLDDPDVYDNLRGLYRKADERYNSGLFHFHKEKDRPESPDELTPRLKIDDKVLKSIFRGLYYPESPYEFSVLPVEILGQVYEQFLGKVIRLTAAHQARVEEKPEVKKAGGVYYTPSYIVDYIVQHTVGRLLEGKTPKEAAKLTVLDPACGSGSFLLGAYRFLLEWHEKQYTEAGPAKYKNVMFQAAGGVWRLTTAEKKRILLNNIYGVDIDPQAVETTKLSLLLKVLEGESQETLDNQFKLFHERALPDLAGNIKCGNSLIGPDFYEGLQPALFDEEEMYRINVFDWNAAFPRIMKAGGFDAVIGNPPYGAVISPAEANYLRAKFEATTKDIDTYCVFMEQAVRFAKAGAKVSMIVPTGWYSGAKFGLLRRLVATKTNPECFINLPYDVFNAWVDTTIFVVAKRGQPIDWPRKDVCMVQLRTFPKRHKISNPAEFEDEQRSANFANWFVNENDEYLTYADTASTSLIRKIQKAGAPLKDFSDVQRGVTPFHLTESPDHLTSRPAFTGTVRRYRFESGTTGYIRFDESLAEPKPERYFQGPRLLLRELISRQFQLQAVMVSQDFVTNKSMQSVLPLSGGPSLAYLLGILNSRLMSWYFLQRSNIAQRDDFPKIVLKETRTLPIPPIDQSIKELLSQHDRMVQLVEHMLALHNQLASAKAPHDKTVLQTQIDATDRQIDRLVYDLYGLTEEEIRIVEGDAK